MNTAVAENVELDMNMISAEAENLGDLETVPVAKLQQAISTEFQPRSKIDESEVVAAMGEIDLGNTNTITRFGAGASEQATSVSREMLAGVRNKDTGPAGELMNDMMLNVRGLGKPSDSSGILGFLKSKASRLASFTQRFESAQGQIETMADDLRTHQHTMMRSVAMMDRLYDATVVQFHELEVYIIAGERKLSELNNGTIPTLQAEVNAGGNGSDGTPEALMPQKLNDLVNSRDQLERKVHDLKLVRMVSLQALPKIRMTQDSDNNLISKIDTVITTTIPMWYQEVAINLEVAKTKKAADAVTNVADATSELIKRGAEEFKTATLAARSAVEQSVVGIEAVEHANQMIIETLQESVAIAQDGKRARQAADKALIGSENALRAALQTTSMSQADA